MRAKYGNASWNVTSFRFAAGIVSIFALSSRVEGLQLRRVRGRVRLVIGRAGRVERAQLGGDRRHVVLATSVGSSQKWGFGSPSTVIVGMPSPSTRRGDLAFAGGLEELVEEVVEADAVRDDQVRTGELAGVLGLGLVVLGPDAGRDDRVTGHAVAADVPDDVGEDGRRRDDDGARLQLPS